MTQPDRLDRTRTPVWYSDNRRGRLFVQFIALGYHCFFQNTINELKTTLGIPNGDTDHYKKGNLDKELGLKRWLEQCSIAHTLDWFDRYEDTQISTPMATTRWKTENTERDRLSR